MSQLKDYLFYQDDHITLYHGDCLEVMRIFPENSVDSVVTDPPYELGFMGKVWDRTGISYNVDMWKEVYRVLKPGGYLLSFGGTRTYHRMACAIEDARFEIRDMVEWMYGSGFPKSLNIGKAIDKTNGTYIRGELSPNSRQSGESPSGCYGIGVQTKTLPNPQSQFAKQWEGWGTALKPAHEPICMARKPLSEKTVASNVLKWGTGGINVDGCRVGYTNNGDKERALAGDAFKRKDTSDKGWSRPWMEDKDKIAEINAASKERAQAGRFPANLIHDGSQEVLRLFPNTKSGDLLKHYKRSGGMPPIGTFEIRDRTGEKEFIGDSGLAARFFYCAKASKSERDRGCEGMPLIERRTHGEMNIDDGGNSHNTTGQHPAIGHNNHPTVKPIALMKYLIKLVTPPNGIILDNFMGSGSTGKAAILEGFHFIGIDTEEKYCEISVKRLRQEVFDFRIQEARV